MRAARFSASHEMDIDKETAKAAKKMAADIKNLPYERIRDELFKAAKLGGGKFAVYLQILDKLKILQHILPELITLKIMTHAPADHPEGGVWTHTLKALEVSNTTDPVKNLAILLHDVGKAVTGELGSGKKAGKMTYYGHAEQGIKLVNTIAKRLRLSNADKQAIIFSIGNHMKFKDILKMRTGKVAKLVGDQNWDVLLAVVKADTYSRGSGFSFTDDFESIVDKALKIKKKHGIESVNRRFQLVSGNHIMDITGLKQGKKIGDIIKKTTDWILDNDIQSQTEIDEYIKGLV
jgi:poly(A) polymerase